MDEDIIKNYQIIKQIGEGSFASVYSGIHRQTKTPVAIKIIPKFLDDPIKMAQINSEVSIQKNIHHPFISRFYEKFENDQFIYIVMESLPEGNLLEYMNRYGPFKEEDAAIVFSEVMIAIHYMHETHKIAHRDIKAENILLDENHNIRIIDFGISKHYDAHREILKTNCGSLLYAAPEIIKEREYTNSVDIWSAGVLLYLLVNGSYPFEDNNFNHLAYKILSEEATFPDGMSIYLRDLISKMLIKDPSERITLKEIMIHPWVRKFITDIDGIIKSSRFDEKLLDEEILKYPTVSKELLRNIAERKFNTEVVRPIRFTKCIKPKYRSLPQIVFNDKPPAVPIRHVSKIKIPNNVKRRVIVQPHLNISSFV